ncbi:hypothetical protein SAMN04488540_105184 [Ferrimonas sediminum]|uniref:Uncharacterized protein n=1 Tax=Ferrimonas sediminum TaxID=718193 RepID=A0A1G8RI63_9GAMM|nr:hypothetical protein [Ferrimonas sediminum]SDJ16676.1 hypothetical protein SAMN04488540_105184 [Ferrimonas sediminum]
MNSPGTLPAPLKVQLPVRRYRLTLHHQLLDALGKVSQFVLQALAGEGRALTDIKRITALTDAHLTPILTRMEGLGWFDSELQRLTEMGQEMAQASELNGQSQGLWLDVVDGISSLQVAEDERQLQPPTDTDDAVTAPEYEKDWNIQKVLQTRRLTKGLTDDNGEAFIDFMTRLWPRHHDILSSQCHAWQFQLSVDGSEPALRYRDIELSTDTPLETDYWKGITVQLPVLQCRIEHQVPNLVAGELTPLPTLTEDYCRVSGMPITQFEPAMARKTDLHWPAATLVPITELVAAGEPLPPLMSRSVSLTQSNRALILGHHTLRQQLHAHQESR